MRILPNIAALASLALLATPALAQQAQQPSQASIVNSLHAQVLAQSDELTLATARLMDAQTQIDKLKGELAALAKPKSSTK